MKSKTSNPNTKKVIVDYHKLNNEILSLLVEKYPDGYDDEDVISFKNAKGDYVDCVEIKTPDTIYLVKISQRVVQAMEAFDTDEEEDDLERDPEDFPLE